MPSPIEDVVRELNATLVELRGLAASHGMGLPAGDPARGHAAEIAAAAGRAASLLERTMAQALGFGSDDVPADIPTLVEAGSAGQKGVRASVPATGERVRGG